MGKRIEILASGFGGQGVVRLGQILGEAAVKQGLRVTMLKSHGTESRGGYVRSQLVLSDDVIDSPMCEHPDIFIAFSGAAYAKFKNTIPSSGLILYDPAHVDTTDPNLGCRQIAFPAKRLATEKLGLPILANSVAMGAIAKLLEGDLDSKLVLESILAIIPKYHEENRKAFNIGYDYIQNETVASAKEEP